MSDTLVGTFTVSVQEDRILLPSHQLVNDDQVRFALTGETNALPTPLVESAYYFVVGARGNDFQVTTHAGTPAMIIEDRGTGSNEVWKQASPGEPELYERQMSSTVVHSITNYDFAVTKLASKLTTMHPNDYESLTVVELREMADQLGLEIPHDARKADIIEDLRRAVQKEAVSEEPPHAEQQNVYEQQMSSTETALVSNEDFWKLKLHS